MLQAKLAGVYIVQEITTLQIVLLLRMRRTGVHLQSIVNLQGGAGIATRSTTIPFVISRG